MKKDYNKIYTIDEIKEITKKVFEKYKIKTAYIFGSYARGEATSKSDIDIMIVKEGSSIRTLLNLTHLENELEELFNKKIDLIIEETYSKISLSENEYGKLAKELFYNELKKDRRKIFG